MIKKNAIFSPSSGVPIIDHRKSNYSALPPTFIWLGDTEVLLDSLPSEPIFDLVVSSPPYNIGKGYEQRRELEDYLDWQSKVIAKIASRLKSTGSLCWQVGNFLEKRKGGRSSTILPLDIVFHDIFRQNGLKLRNRIIWRFGHGFHCKHRLSGRYEVVMWYTKSDEYTFNLDNIRIEQKYPGKKAFKGPNKGEYSGNPKGKNPEDVWEIPNVNSNHKEKTAHPCQFPVALIEPLVKSLSNPNDLVFDPFAGVGSAGVAALIHKRRFWGCEIDEQYTAIAQSRLQDALDGSAVYRPFDQPIYDHKLSNLSRRPWE